MIFFGRTFYRNFKMFKIHFNATLIFDENNEGEKF